MDAFRERCWHEPERCEQILSGTGSRPDRASLCTALKELGIKGKSERKSVAKELLRLEKCCARGLENNPQAVYGRIVRHFCKSKQEIALLRVLQDRVGKQSEFRAFQNTLEDLDDNFDGTVSQEDFGRSLDTLGLGLDADQRQLITRIFLARGKVKYQHFLAVLDPSLSPESNTSISEGGKSFTPSASSEGAQSLSAHGDDLLQTLDGLRDKVLFAQTRGVDTLGVFAQFDPERSGRINNRAFRQGLEALEFDVEREGVALERILYAFRVEDEAGVDYGQFLRFLRNDYDATLGCFDSLLSLQRDGEDNNDDDDDDDDLDDDDDHVAFHDTAKSGPFVAGLTDSRSAARRRKTQLARKEAAKREEGTFVRHSFTAAGHVRQVIVPSAQTGKPGQNRGGGMVERHRVTRHDGKASGRNRSLVYDGVLQTHRSGSKKAKARSGPPTASERLLKEASKPNAVVKYLGYSAHVCNDYPHVGYHGRSQGEKPSGNSILVRNFKSADKARKKRPVSDPALPSKDRSEMTRGEEEEADHSESDISALLFAAHLADQRAILETMEVPFTCDSGRRRTSPADKVSAGHATKSSSTSNSRKTAAQAARAWDRVVSLDRKKYLPTLTHALRERAAKGEPTSEPIQHLFRAARAWSIFGDFTKARDLVARARELVSVMASTRKKDTSQLTPAVPGRSKTRDLKSGSNGLQEATSTRAARLHIHEIPVDVCALRELFTRASEQRRDSQTVLSAARMITRQCVGRDAPLSGLASLVQSKEILSFEDDDAFDSDNDEESETDVEGKGESKREQRSQRIEQVARDFATAMMQRLGKESINSAMSWQDLLQYLRGQESYIANLIRVESVFTRAELHSLRAIFVRACTTTHPASSPDSKDAGLNNGYLGSAVRALGANSRLANAMQLDKHVHGFASGERARALQDALRVYEDFSWEEFLACVAEHASDVAVEELRRWADEVEVTIEFNELSRSARVVYGSAERLKAASTRLELMLESRLDVVDYAEGHPSLLDVYSLLGQMQALEALSEAEAFETRIESRIDQYLSSRSGRAATDEIVRGMMEADRVQRLSKGSRASAELAARAMLRKRKDAEFRAGPGQSVLVATRKEARQHLRTARTLSELVYGFESIEACSSMVASASFYLGCMDKRNDARAADLLSMVLAALDEMNFSGSGSTFATIAHRLADLRASSKDYEDAGRLFARAGAIAESEGDAGLALTRWQRAFRAFDHVHGAVDDQLQASSQVVALINQVGDASAQSESYEKHATVLLKSRQGAEAVRALRQAKALAVSRKRKVVLSRLIASATSSAQLNELDPPNLGLRRDTRETKTTHQETTNSKAGAPTSFDRDGNDEDDTGDDDDNDNDADDPNDADLEFLLQLDDKS